MNEEERPLSDGKGAGREGDRVVFHYDRSRRLDRAPETAQWLASRRSGKKPGFFSALVATRASRILLFTIIGLALYFLASPLFETGGRKSASIGGVRYSAEALYYEGRVIVVVDRRGLPEKASLDDSVAISLRSEAGGESHMQYPLGEAEEGEYRLALDSPGGKPKQVLLHIFMQEGSLDLVVPVK